MHPLPATLSRTFRVACHLLAPAVLVCLAASAADASPHARRHAVRRPAAHTAIASTMPANGPACETRLTLRALQRQARPVGGPVARVPRARTLKQGLPFPKPFIKRGLVSIVDDDDTAAIANDAPAAPVGGDVSVQPALRPIGFLASSGDRLPPSSDLSSHTSRGPPPMA